MDEMKTYENLLQAIDAEANSLIMLGNVCVDYINSDAQEIRTSLEQLFTRIRSAVVISEFGDAEDTDFVLSILPLMPEDILMEFAKIVLQIGLRMYGIVQDS